MKRMLSVMAAVLAPLGVVFAQQAVLYIGSDWCEASVELQKVWEDPDFVAEAGVPLAVVDLPETVDDTAKAKWKEQEAIRWEFQAVPGFAYFDAQGRCVLLRQHLPTVSEAQARVMFKALIKAGKKRAAKVDALLAQGTAEGAGEALSLVVPDLGTRWSHEARGMQSAWDLLKSKDPEDATGWSFALSFDPMESCYRVQDLRKKSGEEAEAFIQELEAKPQKHLSTNQKQGLMMLRAVPLKKTAEENELLKQVVAMDATTHFGLAAQGLLCQRGEGEISVPYGWFPKDVTTSGDATWTVRAGVPLVLREPGHYTLTIKRTAGAGAMQVKSLKLGTRKYGKPTTLAPGEELVIPFEMKKGDARQLTLKVAFDQPQDERGMLTLKPALPECVPTAKRKVERLKAGVRAPWATHAKEPIVAAYARKVLPTKVFRDIAQQPGGLAFLRSFFADQAWMESFFASGKPAVSWETSLRALARIAYHEPLTGKVERTWAAAAALNAGEDPTPAVQLFQAMMEVRATQKLFAGAEDQRADQLRFTMVPAQTSAADVRWLIKEHAVPPRMYGGVCWYAPYRTYNFFGDSVQGSDYYKAWDQSYLRHERSRRVGAVCGGLSYYGSAAAKAHGLPSTPGGQPAHCAYAVWLPGEERWTLAYNVNPYTWTHFDLWDGGAPYSQLELSAVACGDKNYLAAMREYWTAEVMRERRAPTPKLVDVECRAYAWNQRKLPTAFEDLELLGSWQVESFNIAQAGRVDHICLVWTGYYEVAKEMAYEVSVTSDDGALLWIDGELVAGKDGTHGMEGSSQTLTLTEGKHAFELRYFNLNGGRGLEVALKPKCTYEETIIAAYRQAAERCPTNLPLWRAYAEVLKACDEAPLEAWMTLGDAAAKGMKDHVEPALSFLLRTVVPQVRERGGVDAVTEALVRWNGIVRQGPQKTAEFCNYNALLEAQAKLVDGDPERCFKLFLAALPAQYGTNDAFGQLMKWGGARFLKDETYAKRYVAALDDLLKAKGNEGNALGKYVNNAIREASVADNLEAFHALSDLQAALQPAERAAYDFGALSDLPLLSKDGLLKISTTSNWDHPEYYRQVIDDKVAEGNFHTAGEKEPWAELRLPGMAEVSAVHLNNTFGSNAWRLVPFTVEVSEDGKAWQKVAEADKVQDTYSFTFAPVKAQYVRVQTHSPDGNRFLHLRKFAVFGKKLY